MDLVLPFVKMIGVGAVLVVTFGFDWCLFLTKVD